MRLGEYLRDRRLAAGRGVTETGRGLRIPRQTLYLWESSRSKPDPVYIRRLLEFYGCPEREISFALDLRSRISSDAPGDDPSQDVTPASA